MYKVTLMDAVLANANLTTSSTITEYPFGENGVKKPCEKGNLSCEVIITGNGTTGSVKLQACDSGTAGDFQDVPDATTGAIGVAGTFQFSMANAMKKYYRLVYAKGDATTGIVTATLTFS
jgi:hypothetical protein